jgi:hypothetical protein
VGLFTWHRPPRISLDGDDGGMMLRRSGYSME